VFTNSLVSSPRDHCSPPLSFARGRVLSLLYGRGSVETGHSVENALEYGACLCGLNGFMAVDDAVPCYLCERLVSFVAYALLC